MGLIQAADCTRTVGIVPNVLDDLAIPVGGLGQQEPICQPDALASRKRGINGLSTGKDAEVDSASDHRDRLGMDFLKAAELARARCDLS